MIAYLVLRVQPILKQNFWRIHRHASLEMHHSEAVVRGCSVKKVFLEILQVFFLWILRNFQEPLRWLFLIIECIIWLHNISLICDYPKYLWIFLNITKMYCSISPKLKFSNGNSQYFHLLSVSRPKSCLVK